MCTITAASPFDAALHDAFGKLHGAAATHTYGPDFMTHDLGHYLGAEFKGEWLPRTSTRTPKAAHAALPPRRRVDASRMRDVTSPDRRGLARDAAGVDSRQRPHPHQDQVEWQRSRLGRRRVVRVDRVAAGDAAARGVTSGSTRSTSTSAARTSDTCSTFWNDRARGRHRVGAADVEVRLLLAGVRGGLRVLRARARADRHGRVLAERRVRVGDGLRTSTAATISWARAASGSAARSASPPSPSAATRHSAGTTNPGGTGGQLAHSRERGALAAGARHLPAGGVVERQHQSSTTPRRARARRSCRPT